MSFTGIVLKALHFDLREVPQGRYSSLCFLFALAVVCETKNSRSFKHAITVNENLPVEI